MFKAFREVEIRVRKLIKAPDSSIGVKLIEDAFKENGPLWSASIDRGEQVARMELFKGAIGFLKNPPSHPEVRFEDRPRQQKQFCSLTS